MDGSDGWVTAGLGALLILYGGLTLRGYRVNLALPMVAGIGALGLVALGAYKVFRIFESERQMRAEMASSAKDDVFGFGQALSEATRVQIGIGLYLILFAGVVGIVATITVLGSRRVR